MKNITYESLSEILHENVETITNLAAIIEKDLVLAKNYNVSEHTSYELEGSWQGFVGHDDKKDLAAIIVKDHNEVQVVALVDFSKDIQAICETDPDGHGDRFIFSKITDKKLIALRHL